MTGAPLQLGTSPSGISLANTATVENTATPASPPPMSLGEEPRAQPFSPGFDVSERYSLEAGTGLQPAPPIKTQLPLKPPAQPPITDSLNPTPAAEPRDSEPSQNAQVLNLLEPQPPATSPGASTLTDLPSDPAPASQPFNLSLDPPTVLSLQPDPTPQPADTE